MLEWKKLGEIASVSNGERPVSEIHDTGLYPYINAGRTNSGYLNEYNSKSGAITTPSHGEGGIGSVLFQYHDFWCGALCYKMYAIEGVVDRYLFHYLSNNTDKIINCKNVGGQPYINRKQLEGIIIGVPSLSEQTRIVGILDTFTASIANLKEQIAQRRKQYEFYRDQFLDLEGKGGVEMKTLGEVLISLKTGLNPRNNFVLNAPGSNNFYITVRELGLFEIIPVAKTDKVTDEALRLINNRSNLEEGDVLFSGTGTIGRTALVKEKPTNWNIKEGVYALKPHKEIINSRYLVHLLHTNSIIDKISALIVGDPIRSIPMKSLLTVSVPILSLEDQSRTVSILDTFEASIANLEEQLKQREKQYEYYRNKLLTFE